jgi:type IV pilus assembly protein PilM
MKNSVNAYYTKVNNAYDAYLSKPVINGGTYEEIEKVLEETCKNEKIEKFKIVGPRYSDGTVTFSVECDINKEEFAQKLPSDFTKNILADPKFCATSYGGYRITKIEEEGKEPVERISFPSSAKLVSFKSAYHPEQDDKKDDNAK